MTIKFAFSRLYEVDGAPMPQSDSSEESVEEDQESGDDEDGNLERKKRRIGCGGRGNHDPVGKPRPSSGDHHQRKKRCGGQGEENNRPRQRPNGNNHE